MKNIKRKFIIDDPEFIEYIQKQYPAISRIHQFYHFADTVIRISKFEINDGDENSILIRIPDQPIKKEIEINISDNDYDAYINFFNPEKILTRARHQIYEFGHDISVDIFEQDYEGLIIAKIEFESEEEKNKFIPPGTWKETSGNVNYHNSNLFKKLQLNSEKS